MRTLFAATAAFFFMQGTALATDVAVGVTVSGEVAPGVYGRVSIGNAPPPVVYAQPVIIAQQPRPLAPIYLHVPPGHAKNWGKHCGKYNACGRPVYFVKSAEYEPGYVYGSHAAPSKHGKKGHGPDDNKGRGKDKGKEGKGRDKGHGHDH
ncbi:hypothetical protein GCM10027343_04000 [Noviherbaspirillum agri]